MQCLEERSGIDQRVVRLVVPLGATVNMDGVAIYLPVAAIFIAQYREVDLDFAKIIIIGIIGIALSIGTAGIPAVRN